jgi:tetratricopeptide (TPR) repeat protein
MAKAFQDTQGPLGEKLLRAIEAGQAAGGDSRGMQSAAILIVKDKGGYGGFNDRYCDLRVDDAKDPIQELRRIFGMWQLQALINEGYQRVEAGDFAGAVALGERLVMLYPTSAEAKYDLACYLSRSGKRAEALVQLEAALTLDAALSTRAATDTDFGALQGDPKFQALTSKAKR